MSDCKNDGAGALRGSDIIAGAGDGCDWAPLSEAATFCDCAFCAALPLPVESDVVSKEIAYLSIVEVPV